MDDNISILHRNVEKIKEYIVKKYGERLFTKAVAVVREAEKARSWLGFTGQSVAGYGVVTYTTVSGGNYEYTAYSDGGVSVVRAKIEKGDRVRLETPYEGDARWVRGSTDIKYSDVSSGFEDIKTQPVPTSTMFAVRFGYPVEYAPYLVNRGDATNEKQPLQLMYDIAKVSLKH